MSKDRDGIAGDADDAAQARAAHDGDAAIESDESAADALTDPESEIADADEVEAAIEAAEESAGIESEGELTEDGLTEDELDEEFAAEDELDDEDADSEDADAVVEEAAMATAGAGSARAAARGRAPVRAGTTTKKATATKPRETVEATGPIGRLSRFLREVVAELRKVIWPSRKQMVTYTLVVIVFLAIMVALVAGLDVLFLYLAGALFA